MARLALLRMLESYFRHRWLHLIPVVLFMIAAVGYLILLRPEYVSAGVLYVEDKSLLSSLNSIRAESFTWITPAQATTEEISELMQSEAFPRAVIEGTYLEDEMSKGPEVVEELVSGVRESVWVQAQGKNQVLVGVTHERRIFAFQLVSSVIDTYIDWKINSEIRQSSTAQTFFDGVIETYEMELEEARDELERYYISHPAPLRGDRSERELLEIEKLRALLDLSARRYAGALEKREDAELAMSETESDIRQTYYVLDAPRTPDKPEMSKKQLAGELLIFVAAGVVISTMSIAGTAVLDRSLRFPIDVQHRIGLPVLGTVPLAVVEPEPTAEQEAAAERGEAEKEEDSEAETRAFPNGRGRLEQVNA